MPEVLIVLLQHSVSEAAEAPYSADEQGAATEGRRWWRAAS